MLRGTEGFVLLFPEDSKFKDEAALAQVRGKGQPRVRKRFSHLHPAGTH